MSELRNIKRRLLGMTLQFYAEDAAFYLEKAIEAMEEGQKDPETWERDQMEIAKIFQRLIPYSVRRMSRNSLEDLAVDQAGEDSTEPECDTHP